MARELELREQIRQDTAASLGQGYFGGLGHVGYPFGGQPIGLSALGFGEGKFASELSRLQFQAPAERGLHTACEESEKLLERYRRERHMFTPMASEQNARASGKSNTLEPVKSVSTKVAEERELEKRLFMRSYNPYVDGVYPHPNYAAGHRIPEMAAASDKAQREELATLARSRPLAVNKDGSPIAVDGIPRPQGAPTFGLDRISEMECRAQEDTLRQMHVLSPTRQTLNEAYRYRY